MIPLDDFLAFPAGAFVLLVIPGPAVLLVVAQSLPQGKPAGLACTLGTLAPMLGPAIAVTAR